MKATWQAGFLKSRDQANRVTSLHLWRNRGSNISLVELKTEFCIVHEGQGGRSGVDRAASSDTRGPGFEPRPLHLKKYHFFTRNQVALRS